jgi:hypothetical protein
MGHFDYIMPMGQWFTPLVPLPKRLAALDDGIAKGLNGDDGGTWAPLKPIVLGGSQGLQLGASSTITGGVTARAGGLLSLGNNDFPTFSGARTRTVEVPLTPHNASNNNADCDFSSLYGCLRTLVNGATTWIAVPGRYIHNGATLSTITMSYRVGRPHSALPITQPTLLAYRVTTAGVQAALAGAAAAVADASAQAYYAAGNRKTLVLTCTTNNVIDTSQYTYIVRWVEETGASTQPPLNLLHSLTLGYTAIADMRFE